MAGTSVILDRVVTIQVANDWAFTSGVSDVSHVVAESMSVEEILSDKDVIFGSLYSSKFEVQLYNDGSLDNTDLTGKYIRVIITEDETDKPIFFGIVDSYKKDYSNSFRDLIAYDPSYQLGRKDVAWYYNLFWLLWKQGGGGDYCMIKQIRDMIVDGICTGLGIPYDTLPRMLDDNFEIKYSVGINNISVTNLFSMLFATSGRCLRFDRSGRLTTVSLNHASTGDEIELDGLYEKENSTFEETSLLGYTGVYFYDVQNNLIYPDIDPQEQSLSDNYRPYSIKDNLLFQKALDDGGYTALDTLSTALSDELYYIRYTPANISLIVSDLDMQLGDYCSVSVEGSTLYVPVLKNQLSGPLLVNQTISAEGTTHFDETDVSTNFVDKVIDEKISESGGGGGGGQNLTATIAPILLSASLIVGGFTEAVNMQQVVEQRIVTASDVSFSQGDSPYIANDGTSISLKTEYTYDGVVESIDEGYLSSVSVDTSHFASVSDIEVNV